MAVPRNRHTHTRRDNKRAHLKLSKATLAHCEKCKALKQPHTLCENCGTYKGREVIDVLAQLDKKERKQREREIKDQAESEETPQEVSMEALSK